MTRRGSENGAVPSYDVCAEGGRETTNFWIVGDEETQGGGAQKKKQVFGAYMEGKKRQHYSIRG